MKRTFLNKATFKFLLGFNKESFQASSALLFDDEVTFGDPHVTIHLLLMRMKRVILEIQKILHNAIFAHATHIYSQIWFFSKLHQNSISSCKFNSYIPYVQISYFYFAFIFSSSCLTNKIKNMPFRLRQQLLRDKEEDTQQEFIVAGVQQRESTSM